MRASAEVTPIFLAIKTPSRYRLDTRTFGEFLLVRTFKGVSTFDGVMPLAIVCTYTLAVELEQATIADPVAPACSLDIIQTKMSATSGMRASASNVKASFIQFGMLIQ